MHINRKDLDVPCFKFVNGIECPRRFRNLSTRSAHISRDHKFHEVEHTDVQNDELIDVDSPTADFSETFENAQTYDDVQFEDSFEHPLETSFSQFVLNLRANNVPDVIVQSILQNVEVVLEESLQNFSSVIKKQLKSEHGIKLDDIVDVPQYIANSVSIFRKLSSRSKQTQYFSKEMGMIKPWRIELSKGSVRDTRGDIGENRANKLASDSMMYIPIPEILEGLLSHPGWEKIQEEKSQGNDGILHCFSDGSAAKENELLQQHPDALPLFLYEDKMNLNDTASSRPVIMSMYYISVGNLHQKAKSKLNMIHLVLVVEADVAKNYEQADIVRPIIQDLKRLEEGILLKNGKVVYAFLGALKGDNPAVQKLGGFKESGSAKHGCRICIDQLSTHVEEIASLLRTKDQYDEQVRLLSSATNMQGKDYLSKEYGLNRDCEFNELKYFHVIGGTPPDFFHDFLEGCIPRTLFFLLRRLLMSSSKVASLELFNDLLSEFDYGYSETKPSLILKQHLQDGGKLHQTGSQMWSLAVIVPLILGPLVDADDKFWRNYITLLEITSLAGAHQISTNMVAYLKEIVADYLESFQELYDQHLVPKQHSLVHLSTHFLRYGNVYNFNTLREESKHRYFKDVMRKLRNFKNPSYTMANQHQIQQVVAIGSGSLIVPDKGGVVTVSSVANLSYAYLFPTECVMVASLSFFESGGVRYVPKKCFLMLDYANAMPIFGQLERLAYIEDTLFAICEKFESVMHDTHLNGYVIGQSCDPRRYVKRTLEELATPKVFHAHEVDGEFVIVVRRSVGDIH